MALGVGTFTGIRALGMSSDYGDPTSGSYHDASTRSSGITMRTVADVSFGVAILAGAAGAYLLLVKPSDDAANVKSVAVIAGPSFVGIRGEL